MQCLTLPQPAAPGDPGGVAPWPEAAARALSEGVR